MIPLSTALRSSLGKKFLMALTGLVWFGFVVGHLTGNLLLLLGRQAFNDYGEFLEHLGHGKLLPLVEIFLVATLATHVVTGLTVAWADKSRARPRGYEKSPKAGGRSKKTLASTSMAWTGTILLLFLIFHVATFKFGVIQPTSSPAYLEKPHDLYARVVTAFANPVYVGIYTLVMALLGVHLSHGIWSAFQSLGLNNPRIMQVLRPLAYVVAAILAVGFLFLPASIYMFNQQFSSPQGGLFP